MQQSPGFIHIDGPACGNGDMVRIEHDPSDTPSEGADQPRNFCAFTSTDGKYTANVWACNAGTFRIENLAVSETCIVIEGSVEIVDTTGQSAVFRAGDCFLLPMGFSGDWHMPEPFKKYNVMYTP